MELGIHRVVIKFSIEDDRLSRPFNGGEMILSSSEFSWLKENYPQSLVEVPMTNDEWQEHLSSEVHKSYVKAENLQTLSEQIGIKVEKPVAFKEKTWSLHSTATEGKLLDPNIYGGGLKDAIMKAFSYVRDVKDYEERFFSKLNERNKTL